MQKLNRKTKELVEATLIIGVARGEGVNNSSHDGKKDKIKGSIDNLTNLQIEITKQTAVDFLDWQISECWINSSNDLWYLKTDGNPDEGITTAELFDVFENKPKSEGTDVAIYGVGLGLQLTGSGLAKVGILKRNAQIINNVK
jgi:hypothetical protein